MYRPGAATPNRGGLPMDSGDSVVTLDQVPRWSDGEYRYAYENEDGPFPNSYFADPLTSASEAGSSGNGMVSRFPVDHEINSKIYLWRGNPWNLEVDAVVNSTNEVNFDYLPRYFFCGTMNDSYHCVMIKDFWCILLCMIYQFRMEKTLFILII